MRLKNKAIAVTGATGFLGRYIVDALLKRGAHVIGVVRNPARVPELAQRGVELRKADLVDRAALARGFAGVDAVVSNAALFSIRRLASLSRRNWDDHQRTNIQGTQNVFDAIRKAHVKRVVQVSSVAVYRGNSGVIGEDHPQLNADDRPNPITAYAISKALSEQLAWKLAAERELELTTVRPCGIYGAFDPNFMVVLKWLLRWPVTVVPAWLNLPFVYAGDVAEAIALALEEPIAIGKAYNVTGDEHTFWEFAEAWKEAGGAAPWVMLPVPVPFSQSFDHSRATRELGWHNRPYVEGLRETLELEGRERGRGAA
ncbi:MAG TPA: SDR family NAD(P)-dependent oxidoreductase [Candidatus Kryptonia bacterium]|nr:SDR family NAD(P)-dependent oxidoreductase [Candidatus Kryptonia bacterium]